MSSRRRSDLLVARVLVVQPREALAHTTVRTLRGAGWEPIVVADGDAAVRLAVTDPPTAILLDLTLPALDGWCVLATLGSRERAAGRRVRAGRATRAGPSCSVPPPASTIAVRSSPRCAGCSHPFRPESRDPTPGTDPVGMGLCSVNRRNP